MNETHTTGTAVVRMDLNQGNWTVVDPDYFWQPTVGARCIVRDWDDSEPYRGWVVVVEASPTPHGPGTYMRFETVDFWVEHGGAL